MAATLQEATRGGHRSSARREGTTNQAHDSGKEGHGDKNAPDTREGQHRRSRTSTEGRKGGRATGREGEREEKARLGSSSRQGDTGEMAQSWQRQRRGSSVSQADDQKYQSTLLHGRGMEQNGQGCKGKEQKCEVHSG